MSNEKNAPRRNPWEVDKEFRDEKLGLCVLVKRLPAGPRTRYSLEIGGLRDGKFTPFLNPNYGIEYHNVSMRFDGMAFARLIDEAQMYVAERLQAQEDRFVEMKQRHERKDMERLDKLGAKPGQGLSRFKSKPAKTEKAAPSAQ